MTTTLSTVLVAALVAALTGTLTVLITKGKYGMLAIGFVVRICWVVGAIRLAKPGSAWARTFYDRAQLDESLRRFPDSAGTQDAVPAPPRSPMPRPLRIGVACLMLCLLSGLTTALGGLLTGPAMALIPFVIAGVRWTRTTVFALAGVLALFAAFEVVSTAHPVLPAVVGTVRLLLLGAAVRLVVWDPSAQRHFTARGRPSDRRRRRLSRSRRD